MKYKTLTEAFENVDMSVIKNPMSEYSKSTMKELKINFHDGELNMSNPLAKFNKTIAEDLKMNTESEDDDKEFSELLEEYQDQEKIYNFEGNNGLDNLNKICAAIGYRGHGFKYGSSLEEFLADNSGACVAIIEWLSENVSQENREDLISNLKLTEHETESSSYVECVQEKRHNFNLDAEGKCINCGVDAPCFALDK